MTAIAIIGAGCSGLAAAHVLLDAGWKVTLFEKSDRVGGRATTHTRSGFIYDDGAQYIKPGQPDSVSLVTTRFRVPDLIDIEKPGISTGGFITASFKLGAKVLATRSGRVRTASVSRTK